MPASFVHGLFGLRCGLLSNRLVGLGFASAHRKPYKSPRVLALVIWGSEDSDAGELEEAFEKLGGILLVYVVCIWE